MKTKNLFSSMLKSSLMLLAAVTISFAMTSCSDDDDKGSTVSPYKQWLLTGENNFLGGENVTAMVLDATNPTMMAIMAKPTAEIGLDPDLFYFDGYLPYSITLNADGTSGTINIEGAQCPFKNLTANSVDVTLPGSPAQTVHATVPSSKIEASKGSFSTTDGTRRIIKSAAFYYDDDEYEYYNIVLSDAEETLTPGKKPKGTWLAIDIPEDFAYGTEYDITDNLSTEYVDFTIYEDGAWYYNDDFASGTIRVDIDDTDFGYIVDFRLDGTLNNGKKISVKAFGEASKAASYIWPSVLR